MTATAQQQTAFDHQVLVDSRCTHGDIASQGTSLSIEEELVIGIFCSWGSGKSHVLDATGNKFAGHATKDNSHTVITVRFNAWQYEKEPLLMVPLLKHVEIAVQNKQQQLQETAWQKLKNFFARSGAAFASSLQGKVSVTLNTKNTPTGLPLIVDKLLGFGDCTLELAVNPKDFIDSLKTDTSNTDQQANTSPYYEFTSNDKASWQKRRHISNAASWGSATWTQRGVSETSHSWRAEPRLKTEWSAILGTDYMYKDFFEK